MPKLSSIFLFASANRLSFSSRIYIIVVWVSVCPSALDITGRSTFWLYATLAQVWRAQYDVRLQSIPAYIAIFFRSRLYWPKANRYCRSALVENSDEISGNTNSRLSSIYLLIISVIHCRNFTTTFCPVLCRWYVIEPSWSCDFLRNAMSTKGIPWV